jgi:hypothetical protein
MSLPDMWAMASLDTIAIQIHAFVVLKKLSIGIIANIKRQLNERRSFYYFNCRHSYFWSQYGCFLSN